MIPLPSTIRPFVDKMGKILSPWNSYLQQFTQAPPATMSLTVGASPYSFQAKEPGLIVITLGTLTTVQLDRGGFIINLTNARVVPLAVNDTIIITYSVIPTVRFLASYGQNTTAV